MAIPESMKLLLVPLKTNAYLFILYKGFEDANMGGLKALPKQCCDLKIAPTGVQCPLLKVGRSILIKHPTSFYSPPSSVYFVHFMYL